MTEFKAGDRGIGLAAYPDYDSELIEGDVWEYQNPTRPDVLVIETTGVGFLRSMLRRTAVLIDDEHDSERAGSLARGLGEEHPVVDAYKTGGRAIGDGDWMSSTGGQSTARGNVLTEAKGLIEGDRNKSYGSPTQNFTNTAEIWTALLRHKLKDGEAITATEVGTLMVGLKLARTIAQPKRDNFVDMAGYAACAWQTIADTEEAQ